LGSVLAYFACNDILNLLTLLINRFYLNINNAAYRYCFDKKYGQLIITGGTMKPDFEDDKYVFSLMLGSIVVGIVVMALMM
jgi:hypothetical protein